MIASLRHGTMADLPERGRDGGEEVAGPRRVRRRQGGLVRHRRAHRRPETWRPRAAVEAEQRTRLGRLLRPPQVTLPPPL